MTPELVATLARDFPEFVFFKDTSGNDAVATAASDPDGECDLAGVFLVRGAEGDYARALKTEGGVYDGLLLSTANSFGGELATIIEWSAAGRHAEAHRLSDRLASLVSEVFALVAGDSPTAMRSRTRARPSTISTPTDPVLSGLPPRGCTRGVLCRARCSPPRGMRSRVTTCSPDGAISTDLPRRLLYTRVCTGLYPPRRTSPASPPGGSDPLSPTENAASSRGQATRGPAAATAGAEDKGHPHKWFILAAVSLGMFMSLLDMTIVNIAMPAIIEYFHTSISSASWVLNAYSLTLGVLFLSMGRLADKFGQKRIFVMGLSIFTFFSLLCGLSPGIGWLIAFRVGQAVGGAAMAPISLAILMTAFPAHQRGAAIGIWGALGSVAAAVGPTLGGILVTYGAWHWIFFVNIPIGIFALVFALVVVPERRRAGAEESVDAVGVAVSTVGLFCLTLALLKGNDWGWSSPSIVGLLAVAILSYPAFIWWEHRTRWPMFDFRLLRIRSFAAANTTIMFIGATMGGSMLLLVLFMVTVLGYTELKAAVTMTAAPLVAIVVGPIIGRYVDRIGPRVPAAIGAALFSVSMLLFAGLDASASQSDIIWRGAILGLGLGFTMPTVSAAAMGSVPDRSRGVASGALNMMRQIGFTLGIAVLVSLFTHAMTVNTQAATTQAVQYVQEQSQLPPQAQQQIVAALEKGATAGANGANDALKNAPKAPAGTPQAQAQEKLVATIGAIYKNNIAKSFPLPFYFAALAAALAIIPALMTGRRLGEDLGHETMTRAQRAATNSGEV